jgi:hypothetical protein
VSCPSATLCVAVNGANPGGPARKILTTTEPTAGQWQVAQLDDSLHFTGGSGAWHAENLVPFEASESEGQFVHNALVGSDSRIFTSTTPFAAATGAGGGPGSGGKAPPIDHAPARPKAFLVFAENFWRITRTRHRRVRSATGPTGLRGPGAVLHFRVGRRR